MYRGGQFLERQVYEVNYKQFLLRILVMILLFPFFIQMQVEGNYQEYSDIDAPDIPLMDSLTYHHIDSKREFNSVEVMSERTINSKTFVGPGNKKTVRYANQPEHYFNDGEWKEINTNFKRKETKESLAVMDENNYKVEIMKDSPGVKIKMDSYSIKYEPIDTNQDSKVKIKENTFAYPDLWENSDLIYSATNNSLKMYIVLNKKAKDEYEFRIETQGLNATLNEDESISFLDSNGKKRFEIPPMWVKSKDSEVKHFEKIAVSLTKTVNGYTLKIKLDDSGLQYPLVIDPSTVSFFASDQHSNKIYIDTYEMYTNEIEEIVFTNNILDLSDLSSSENIEYPMNVYLVHQDVETNGEGIPYGYYGCCSLAPGDDGILATEVGRTTDFIDSTNEFVLNAEDINRMFSDKKRVSGVAFWVPQLEPGTEYDMYNYVYITYNPSIVSPPIITHTSNDNEKLYWKYWDKDGTNTQVNYRIFIYDNTEKIILNTGYVNSKNTYYTLPTNLQHGFYRWNLLITDNTGEMDFKESDFYYGDDPTPPTQPKDLSVISKEKSSVTLSWKEASDNVGIESYSVLVNGTLVKTISNQLVVVTIDNLKEGFVNTITLRANDYAGNYSDTQIKVPHGKLVYKYDAQNRLDYIEFELTGNLYMNYTYDKNGNLIKKVFDN